MLSAFCHYRPEQSKDRFNGKICGADEACARKLDILLLLIIVSLLQLNVMHSVKPWLHYTFM